MTNTNRNALAILGLGGAIWALSKIGQKSGMYSYGNEQPRVTTKGLVYRDPRDLLPAFADKLEILFQRLRASGFDPVLWEAWRSNERAKLLTARGVGIMDSMHTHRAAADIISQKHLWSSRPFFEALGKEAEKLGLTWGGHFTDEDFPHVQAVPYRMENNFKNVPLASRDNFLKLYYQGVAVT